MRDDFSLPQTSWIALLSIAHRFNFSNVRKRAIQEIFHPPGPTKQQSKDYVMLLSLGDKYVVPQKDLLPLLAALVVRPQYLTEDEVAHLPALTVSRLARAREELACEIANPDVLGCRCIGAIPWPVLRDNIAKKIVCRIWRIRQDG
jgi:hypothetical protein